MGAPRGARASAAAALAAAVAGVAACGGPLSPGEFREQASAICAGDAQEIARLPPPVGRPAARAWVQRVLGIVGDDLTRLRELDPPPSLRRGVRAALRAQQREVDELRSLRSDLAAGAGPARTAAGLRTLDRLGRQSDEAFHAAGLPECASS